MPAASSDSPTGALVLCLLPEGAENSPVPNALPADSCTAPCGEGPHVPPSTGTLRQGGHGHGEPWGHGDQRWSSWDRHCLSDSCFLQGISEAGNRNVPSTGLDLAQMFSTRQYCSRSPSAQMQQVGAEQLQLPAPRR